ncbi:cell division cycle- protein [Xylographa bjoerkii]|nr:cell division cycle- protein [Xylographa bjoerkii]
MERSSPLAAMQPQSLPFGHWGFRIDGPTSNPPFGGGIGCGAISNFNFKDLSMNKPHPDYFSLKPIRGSSPTACLAADLSQNFHIDQSPQMPTPRRSLFTSNLLGTLGSRDSIITPPCESSSPCPQGDSMDVSPLPHKQPFLASAQITVQSPTPEPTPAPENTLSSPFTIPESPLNTVKVPVVIERTRRSTMLRPSLIRTKGYTTNSISLKSVASDNLIPPFKFGNGSTTATASLLSLEECFVESPKQAMFSPPPTSTMGPPRPKTAFPNPGCVSRNNGSPQPNFIRKSNAPMQRPRKQFRRSLSMFEHPADVMKKQQEIEQRTECSMTSAMDLDDAPLLQLPHFFAEDETIPRISRETMIEVLNGKYKQCYEQSTVIDCRFEYEYKGGHIDGAINFNNKEELAGKLFELPTPLKNLLIFHCEYSAHRAPIAARFIRHEDRATNAHQYPKLTYPEVYILDGGYSAFFKEHRVRCSPQNYVEMNAKEYANACERGLGRIKQQRGKLSRAQTFAFGQYPQSLNDSPTAPNRSCGDLMIGMDVSMDTAADPKRIHTRRMASY